MALKRAYSVVPRHKTPAEVDMVAALNRRNLTTLETLTQWPVHKSNPGSLDLKVSISRIFYDLTVSILLSYSMTLR